MSPVITPLCESCATLITSEMQGWTGMRQDMAFQMVFTSECLVALLAGVRIVL
jgi:hypothetical protein